MLKIWAVLFLVFFSYHSVAALRSFGHNLSHTDYIPVDHHCTVGIQISGCGTSHYFVGTSPFLLYDYNMSNLYLKFHVKKTKALTHTIEFAYFNTFEKKGTYEFKYDMRAYWAYYILSLSVAPNYKIHINLVGGYFSNEKYPFSLHRPTINKNPTQWNLTTLHEVQVTDHFVMQAELGVIHIFATYPRVHMGASLIYRWKRLLVQFGFTVSSTLDGLIVDTNNLARMDYQQYLLRTAQGYNGEFYRGYIRTDFSLHPEIALQFYF